MWGFVLCGLGVGSKSLSQQPHSSGRPRLVCSCSPLPPVHALLTEGAPCSVGLHFSKLFVRAALPTLSFLSLKLMGEENLVFYYLIQSCEREPCLKCQQQEITMELLVLWNCIYFCADSKFSWLWSWSCVMTITLRILLIKDLLIVFRIFIALLWTINDLKITDKWIKLIKISSKVHYFK